MKNGKLKRFFDWFLYHVIVKPICIVLFLAVEIAWIWFLCWLFACIFL